MCNEFGKTFVNVQGNYAKETVGFFTRIIGKISALIILQCINFKNNKPIGQIKYTLPVGGIKKLIV